MTTAATIFLETISPDGVKIPLPYFHHDEPPLGLVVILPGAGYLLEHPVLHYLSKMAGEVGYDVLGVPYSFQITRSNIFPGYDVLHQEVTRALDVVLAQRQYQRVVLVGKSLGTPLAVHQIGNLRAVRDLRLILLTPIDHSTEAARDYPTMAVIGTDDSRYDARQVEVDAVHPYLRWHVFDGLNHGLEYATGWDTSIAAMGNIISQCEAFLSQT